MLYVTYFLPFRSQAPLATVFAGSPQILGMVKLCSGLAVTSLPLYSDINLLRRTENVSAVMFKLNITASECLLLNRNNVENNKVNFLSSSSDLPGVRNEICRGYL